MDLKELEHEVGWWFYCFIELQLNNAAICPIGWKMCVWYESRVNPCFVYAALNEAFSSTFNKRPPCSLFYYVKKFETTLQHENP